MQLLPVELHLEPRHSELLDAIKGALGFIDRSEALRFVIDMACLEDEQTQIELATEELAAMVKDMKSAVARAENSSDRALAYFAERRELRNRENK